MSESAAAAAAERTGAKATAIASTSATTAGTTVVPLVLNVNDDEALRYVTTTILARGGCRVIEAANGEEALALIRAHAPDVVILDVGLPDLSGYEVCKRIRADVDAAPTKILCTSATHVTLENKLQGLEVGADGYLIQPFERQELLATVLALVRLGRAERELHSRAARLADADRRKTELLAVLAHELRNPLGAISSSLPLLERRSPEDEVERRARDVMRRQLAHLTSLVDDLLDASRVTQGKIDLRCETLDVAALAARAAAAARDRLCTPRAQVLHVDVPPRPVLVRGDATRLEQVVTNLLDNASKFTDDGGAIFVDVAADGVITVRDTGIGIPPDRLEAIFGLFTQANEPRARQRGGLGIGLALVKSLVELQGGTVSAHSAGPGSGTSVRVTLPLTEQPSSSSSPSAAPAQASAVQASSPVAAPKTRRLLIVEDNEDAQWALRDLCEMWGHEVHVASDGPSGVSLALSARPDIALVDIGLPLLDGYEVARRIRAEGGERPLLLVALTGYGAPEQKEQALRSGFDMHLVKPVSVKALEGLLSSRDERATNERS